MALIAAGAGVMDISGSVGPYTFARNRSGLYVRERVTPSNPSSAAQVRSRADLVIAARQWTSNLTATHRARWASWSVAHPVTDRFGTSRLRSPYHWYCHWRSLQRLLLTSYSRTPPASLLRPSADYSASVAVNAARTITLTFDDSRRWCSYWYPIPEVPGAYSPSALLVFAYRPASAGATPAHNAAVYVGRLLSSPVTPPTSPNSSLVYPYAVTAGQRVRLRCIILEGDGATAPPVYLDAVVSP